MGVSGEFGLCTRIRSQGGNRTIETGARGVLELVQDGSGVESDVG